MAKLSVKLWKTLQQLKEDEFKKFKWLLKQDNTSKGPSSISAAQLETADRQDTVDLMAHKYGGTGAVRETISVLEKISRNDLVQSLKNSCADPEDLRPQDCDTTKVGPRSQQQLSLDPDTSRPSCIASDVRRKLLDNPEGFFRCVCWGQNKELDNRK